MKYYIQERSEEDGVLIMLGKETEPGWLHVTAAQILDSDGVTSPWRLPVWTHTDLEIDPKEEPSWIYTREVSEGEAAMILFEAEGVETFNLSSSDYIPNGKYQPSLQPPA